MPATLLKASFCQTPHSEGFTCHFCTHLSTPSSFASSFAPYIAVPAHREDVELDLAVFPGILPVAAWDLVGRTKQLALSRKSDPATTTAGIVSGSTWKNTSDSPVPGL